MASSSAFVATDIQTLSKDESVAFIQGKPHGDVPTVFDASARGLEPPLTPSDDHEIIYLPYLGEEQMPQIIGLIEKELSEPYIIFTYRYFVNQWPHLSLISSYSHPDPTLLPVGVIVSKLDRHLKGKRLQRGYIAMLSVKNQWRGRGIAKKLVQMNLEKMVDDGAQEIVLETEADNSAALCLYERLGFIREKRLFRFYLNGKDSFRLVLPIPDVAQEGAPFSVEDPSTHVGGSLKYPAEPPPHHQHQQRVGMLGWDEIDDDDIQ
ncbi:acyl-CoA N-acyltransferase [Violaceomyces palustris]|uniref:Acyl-CoA N-acyltransferase n=1 Tax=Violaceomyces palustris TaxID=1673888 RepID=A0ACD0P7Y8_9BASI|nr:acyl-CoA N-acyltransferase [Violaceomyces palustris]